ncbi:MAG: triose-phosphate isomerase [Chloroflexota bacterium]|nr:triose-phosphate isomerase [Chloroflexota bacterium]
MRTPIIAGNWKMHNTIEEAVALAKEMRDGLDAIKGVEVVLCPPFVALSAVAAVTSDTSIKLGAQNVHWEEEGAYTGEVSPRMLEGLCQYVIIGHSERRRPPSKGGPGETDETINKKVKVALNHNLMPIICVGEILEQREAGRTEEWVSGQVRDALSGLSSDDVRGLVIAYEPIWAIGTGRAATPDDASAVIGSAIRGTIAELYDKATARAMRVQYGGSVNPANIGPFLAKPDIDGALVGGASLRAKDFLEIVRIAAQAKGVQRK